MGLSDNAREPLGGRDVRGARRRELRGAFRDVARAAAEGDRPRVCPSGANFGAPAAQGGRREPAAARVRVDGRAAPTLDENGVSAALHRCETPPRADATVTRRTAAVLPPGAVLPAGDGTGGTLEGARAVWTDTPWTRAGAVTVNKRALRFESGARFRETPSADDGARRAEDGGDAFVAALVLEDARDRSFFFTTGTSKGQTETNAYPPTRSIDESPKHRRVTEGDFADVLSSVGCAFGATRVAARADGDGDERGFRVSRRRGPRDPDPDPDPDPAARRSLGWAPGSPSA